MNQSPQKTLVDMPEVAMKNIMKYVDFRTILCLRKVCHDLRNFIEDHKPESHLELVSITFHSDHIQLDLPFNIIMAKYQKQEHGALVSYTGTNKTQKFLDGSDFLELFLNDFKIITSNQKTAIRDFHVHFNGTLEPLKFKSWSPKNPVKSCSIRTTRQLEVLSILPILDPESLESLSISSPDGIQDMEIDEIVKLEQWKNLKTMNFHKLKIHTDLRNFEHMETVFFHWNWFSGQEMMQMKEMFLTSSTLSSVIIHCQSINKSQYDHVLGEPWEGRSPFGTTQYHWNVKDTKRNRILKVCLSASTPCTRHTNSTILFAYSTDSLQYDVNSAVDQIVWLVRPSYGYTTFANVRIDVKNKEEIQYHGDLKSFNASVYDHPTDSSIGYGDTTTGSDVFDMIEKFFNNNNQAPVCGSIIYVLVKRYPNTVDVTNLVNRLRQNRVFVYFIVHTVPSGGGSTHELFDMASRTNGFCIFMDTRNYWVVANSGTAVMWRPYQFLAHNYIVSGSGRIELPVFRTPNPKASSEQMLVVITVQDHAIDNNFVLLNYTIASTDGNYTFVGPDQDSGYPRFGSGIIAQPSGVRGLTDLKMTIDYSYRTTQQQVIEVRMHSNYYHDFIPFATTETGCTRRTNTTILLAYSTDSLQYDVDVARSDIVFEAQPPFFFGITTFANVRFDMKNEDEIQYHSDVFAFNASVNARPVDAALGYGDTTTGSDVFKMIQKFVNNNQAPTCGSIVYVLVKRYPNDVDVTNLVSQLRANHIFVYFIVHNIPSGGITTDPLFEVASKTNGFSVFMGNPNYWLVVYSGLGVLYRPYQYFAQNYIVTGAGRIEIPTFKTPSPYSWAEQVMIVVTIQDHKLDSNYISLNYTISTADEGRVIFTAPETGIGNIRFGSGIIDYPPLNGTTGYKMTIDYNYRTTQQQVIEVRMYSYFYNDFVALPSN
ncbi:unnamed protein product [Caenorhabditis brenneri]